MPTFFLSKLPKLFALFFIIVLSLLFSAKKVNLMTADLGRHISNGKIIVSTLKVPTTNYYSYTEPEFPVVMHHWGAGVAFYIVWKYLGFKGLSLFYIFMNLAAFLFIIVHFRQRAIFSFMVCAAVFVIPLFFYRTEIRPECFSILFFTLVFAILNFVKYEKISPKFLWVLPFIQLLWVNTHIFFPMGIFLTGLFFLDSFLRKRTNRMVFFSFCIQIAILIFNPNGIAGIVAPFCIFRQYGYLVAENQSVLFMQQRFGGVYYIHFEILFFICCLFLCLLVATKKYKECFVEIVLFVVFAGLAWFMIRMIPFFSGVALIFILSAMLSFDDKIKNVVKIVLGLIFCFFSMTSVVFARDFYLPKKINTGIGLISGVEGSIDFIKENNVSGRLLNNYDIGGAVIFALYPEMKPFVDNRPEAYSVSFFKDIYVPMQQDEKIWKINLIKYQFEIIYFYRHDITPWAQPFLIRRINDPEWAPVFVDSFAIILLRRNKANKNNIAKYELPRDMFVVRKN